MDKLPEFRVTLTRLKPGEEAYSKGIGVLHYDDGGQRTKLGGDPDYEQGDHPNPDCPSCGKRMTFVAQIDSIEHQSDSNPHSVNARSKDQK